MVFTMFFFTDVLVYGDYFARKFMASSGEQLSPSWFSKTLLVNMWMKLAELSRWVYNPNERYEKFCFQPGILPGTPEWQPGR